MASAHREVERKYEPGEDVSLPALGDLPGVAEVAQPVSIELEAVYFDTSDLALAGAGITVRRRTGGDDEGWHLKLPAGDGSRDEVRVPLGRAKRTVPKPLRSTVRAHVRDQAMVPVATLRTHRTAYRLLDSQGHELAEVCDDTVTAHTPPPEDTGLMTAWREWEVELLQGEASLLDAADELVRDAGAVPARGPSKLSRVLGDRIPKTSSRTQRRLRRGGSAASVVHARLGEQVAELKVRDPQVRRDLPDAVHKMRVAMRRLRSALATFRPLLDTSVTEPLREELKWVSGVLGDARDAEVMHARLRSMIAAQPPELVLGAVNRRVDDELGRAYRDAHAASVEVMDSQRYLTLLDDLDALVAEPPWTGPAEQPARDVLPARVQNDWKRLRRRVSMADNASSQTERDQRLHDVRKAAKRVRYAAETLIPIYGDSAEQLANATKQVQSVLGEHQDSVLTLPVLRQLGVQAHLDGDNGFTYGLLLAHEQGRAAETETRYAVVWDKASRKKLRRWLS